jgi:hypothetical protein
MQFSARTRFVLAAAAVVLAFALLGQDFRSAWLSRYTYASASSSADPGPNGQPSAQPPAGSAPETVQKQKPKPAALSRRVVEYHIDVRLDAEKKTLHGEQTVTWTNPGAKTVSEIYFNLYPNAFESPLTTFMRESGGRLRNDRATPESVGGITLRSIIDEDGENLLPRLQYVSPDDGNPHDRTLARLRLSQPVPPGGSVTLRMKFDVKLPRVFARMGYAGDFVMAGQWYPKIAVYETRGTRGRKQEGWNAHQYHGNSEFYGDFGIFSVKIRVPENYKTAATGFLAEMPKIENGVKTYHYYADDVHDFAWAASPDFIYHEESYAARGIPGVRIKLYLDPLHAHLRERYMHAAKSSLAKYAEWYGAYPYSTLSIVVPPKGAGGAGGMEYPTLITAASAEEENPDLSLERTVVHEVGHQYWYGMVATNEFEEAWLDEGFTSYAEDKVMDAIYGIAPNLSLESVWLTDPAPLDQASWKFRDHGHYAENVYLRAKLVLLGIERRAGERKMRSILRTYFQTYKFRHPSARDFQRIVEKVTGDDWDDYFNAFVYGAQAADVAVESIRTAPAEADGVRQYESVVRLSRTGAYTGPVPVLLSFADGSTSMHIWDDDGARTEIRVIRPHPVVWAAADPNRTNLLDNRRYNNFLKAELPRTTRNRWNLGAAKLLESIIARFGW